MTLIIALATLSIATAGAAPSNDAASRSTVGNANIKED
jgi:hypothetical protein